MDHLSGGRDGVEVPGLQGWGWGRQFLADGKGFKVARAGAGLGLWGARALGFWGLLLIVRLKKLRGALTPDS